MLPGVTMGSEKKCPKCGDGGRPEAVTCTRCGYTFTIADLFPPGNKQEQLMFAWSCVGLIVVGLLIYGVLNLGSCSDQTPGQATENIVDVQTNEIALEEVPSAAEQSRPTAPTREMPHTSTISKDEAGEAIATVINLNGLLCARVLNVAPLQVSGDVYEVTCTEYRGGTGTVRYIVNSDTGVAFRQ